MPRWTSLLVLLAIVLLVGVLFYRVISTFVLPLFLALILVVIFRPLSRWIERKLNGRVRVAAALTTLIVLLIVLLPLVGVLTMAAAEAVSFASGMGQTRMGPRIAKLRARFHLEMPPQLTSIDRLAALLDAPPKPSSVYATSRLDAVKSLLHDLSTLRRELNLTAPPPANAVPSEDSQSGDEDLVMELDAWEADLAALLEAEKTNGSPALDELRAVQDRYYSRLRPLLVRRVEPNRLEAWSILAANPSPVQLEEFRQRAVQFLGTDSLGPLALSTGQRVGGYVISFIIGMVVMCIGLYYFLSDGPAMVSAVMKLTPLDKHYVEELLTEFDKVSRAVVVATLASAFAQGLLAGIGYYFAGLDALFLLTVITILLALVPFVGATAVWLPCSLWLFFYEERSTAAAALAIYCLAIVSTVDNLIKPLILHGQSNLHPMLALLSVLGGVKALGPIGIFVGPMAVAFLQAVLNMVRTELNSLARSSSPKP